MKKTENIIGSEMISPEEILLIIGGDIESAIREHEHIRNYLGFNSEDLLISQYCEFNRLDEDDIIEFLNQNRTERKWVIEDEDTLEQDLEILRLIHQIEKEKESLEKSEQHPLFGEIEEQTSQENNN
jgi:hypothetical protein